jgi:replication fork clamp-binding protein CrfC
MDQGTSAKRMLLNEEIPLKLGYIGIKNRAQEDINNKVPVEKSLEDERKFFESHAEYRDLPSEVLGTKSLTAKLSNILMIHIGKCLPAIIKEINTKIEALETRLGELGNALPTNSK